jgi:thiol:disulfide interchange protein DsbD
MIPLTVSFFVKQGEGKKASGLRGAITYALSIVFIYGGLGLLISILFGPSALYTLGSHPIPNFIFFVLFLVFAISFLGAFDITLPSSWSTAMNTKAGAGGILGPFFMALTLVIVSFSCTGPLLGAAVVGSTQGAACTMKPFMAMTGFGVAFGIPFGLLALFPGLLNKLPQAGGWMNTIKVIFGFLELALCMKFLSNVDLALHWHLLDRQIFLGIWIVIFALLGLYFLGKINLPHDEPSEKTSVPRLLFAVASLSFTMYLVPGLWGAPLSVLEGLIPPANTSIGVKLLPHQVASDDVSLNAEICEQDRKYASIYEDREAHGFCMFYDLDQAIAFAKEKNVPVFVDFTGHSCANCRKMENDVWPVEKVMETLKNEFVMVSLYADETERLEEPKVNADGRKLRKIGDWVQDYQSRYYKTIAQPYYALIDFDESALVMPVGYTPDADKFHKYLESGIEAFKKRH